MKARGLSAAMDAEELDILRENPKSLPGDLAINASWAIEGAYLCAWALTLHRALEYDATHGGILERFRAINWILAEDGERYDEVGVDT